MSSRNKNKGVVMKKILLMFFVLFLSIGALPKTFANENGGYAVVDPLTGIVHGIIVADSSDPFNNGGIMPESYNGCPAGCKIVQQSTSDNSGNVFGIHGNNVYYKENTQTFILDNGPKSTTDVVSSFTDNGITTETEIVTTVSKSLYEFGVQDFKKTNGEFEMKEISISSQASANITAFNKVFRCENNNINSCSGISSDILGSIDFSERKTEEEVRSEIVIKQIRSIIDNMSTILNRLKYWVK
jgi:hypothetical protein